MFLRSCQYWMLDLLFLTWMVQLLCFTYMVKLPICSLRYLITFTTHMSLVSESFGLVISIGALFIHYTLGPNSILMSLRVVRHEWIVVMSRFSEWLLDQIFLGLSLNFSHMLQFPIFWVISNLSGQNEVSMFPYWEVNMWFEGNLFDVIDSYGLWFAK